LENQRKGGSATPPKKDGKDDPKGLFLVRKPIILLPLQKEE
jgi:hypothetical protein